MALQEIDSSIDELLYCNKKCDVQEPSAFYFRTLMQSDVAKTKRALIEDHQFDKAENMTIISYKCDLMPNACNIAADYTNNQTATENLKTNSKWNNEKPTIQSDDVLKIGTISKPLSIFEKHLLKRAWHQLRSKTKNRQMLKESFFRWKKFHQKCIVSRDLATRGEQIDNFISELNKHKFQRKKFLRSNSDPLTIQKPSSGHTPVLRRMVTNECFKNRFKTQRDIIETQKIKLEEQTKIIEDFKLGIIRDELSKSLENSKTQIREIFGKCSTKVKCKMAPGNVDAEDGLTNFIMNSSKAPKFVQQMERRALERARNREIILERKRIIDEEKRRIVAEILEKKAAQDEDEKQKNLQAVREKQRAELERQKFIQANKEKYIADLKKATSYYKRKLLRRYLQKLEHNMYIAQNKWIRSEAFHEKFVKRKALENWKQFIIHKFKQQYDVADTLYNKNILTKMFLMWKAMYKESLQNQQAAQDLCEMRLGSRCFIHWHRYVCIQYVIEEKNMKKAEKHYNSRVLVQYFYQWRTLHAVLQLEKTKEEKKRRWREKVWEILPDYRPPDED